MSPAAANARVLVVEDEMVVQLHLTRIVQELGYELAGAAMNTTEALELARRQRPALVLMDIHLADGDDGVDTALALRRELDCAVVFVTAYADEKTVERTALVGAAGYLVKPFTAASVRAALATALSSHVRLKSVEQRAQALSSVLDQLGDALLVLDHEGRVSFANPRACKLSGTPMHEVHGRAFAEVVRVAVEGDQARLFDALARAQGGNTASIPRLAIRDRAGAERTVDLELEPARDGAGEDGAAAQANGSAGVLVSLRDRSARRARAPAAIASVRRPFGEGTRLLVYSHDTFGLGHLRRCLALLRTLCARHPRASALLVTGSPLVHRYAMPSGADYVKLPALRKVESEQYEARTLNVSGASIRSLRANLILHTMREYDPNALLVDHSPTGSKGELLPALEWLASHGGCTRILGLRDILDEPRAVIDLWRASGVYEVLRQHYDHLVVYGNRLVYDPVKSYELPPDVAARTRFVNYVCDTSEPVIEDARDPDPRPLVVVSIGGGDGGGETVIGPFLEMMHEFRARIDFRAEILTGPFLAPELESQFRARARGLPVTLRGFIPSTAALLRRAEVVVCTTGYNTATDLLAHARAAVLVPRVMYRQEQWIRAKRFAELGLTTTLHPDEVSPRRLFEAIEVARGDAPLARARAQGLVPLDGAERFAEFCGGLLIEARERS